MKSLHDKTLVMLVGPSAIGKSTVMNQVTKLDQRFSRVKSFTTRHPRANDEPDQYFYLQAGDLDQLASTGDIVSQVTFPTTGQTYGTLLSSYPGNYNLLDTLANSVETYRQLPFKATTAISLTTTASTWLEWFLSRYPAPSDEAEKRLQEARLSIGWSLDQAQDHRWLINDSDANQVAQKLVDMTINNLPGDDGSRQARAILNIIERGEVWQNPK